MFNRSWRSEVFPVKPQVGLTDVYEFGVFSGNSTAELSTLCDEYGIPCERVVGFDSFDGVPKETAEPCYNDVWDPDISHYYKAFNSKLFYGVNTVDEAVRKVDEFVRPFISKNRDLIWVAGFYNESLTDDLPSQLALNKALIVDIDVDIYSSAKTALHWLFRNKLVDVGTYVFYDDWGGTPGYKEFLDGESRAHREISEEFNVTWELVGTSTGHVVDSQVVWQIKSIG